MTILNATDAAKAAVTPAAATALYLPLQNLDGTPAGRIKLSGVLPHGDSTTLTEAADGTLSVVGQAPTPVSSGVTLGSLAILQANGTYLTGSQLQALLGTTTSSSTPTPTPTPAATPTATTISFTGAAGTQPTGTAALTSVGSNPPTGMALNGSGALLLPSQTFAYALLEGMGTHGDGTLEIDAAGGAQPLDLTVLLHASADNSTNSAAAFQGEFGHVIAYLQGVSSGTTFSAPATFSKIRVTVAGGSMTIVVDGTTLGTVTGGTSPASGYLGIGSSSATSPQVGISGVSFQ